MSQNSDRRELCGGVERTRGPGCGFLSLTCPGTYVLPPTMGGPHRPLGSGARADVSCQIDNLRAAVEGVCSELAATMGCSPSQFLSRFWQTRAVPELVPGMRLRTVDWHALLLILAICGPWYTARDASIRPLIA